jgi:hypothetical protein
LFHDIENKRERAVDRDVYILKLPRIRKQWVNLLSGVWEEANRLRLAYGSRGRKYFRFSFEPGEIGGSF